MIHLSNAHYCATSVVGEGRSPAEFSVGRYTFYEASLCALKWCKSAHLDSYIYSMLSCHYVQPAGDTEPTEFYPISLCEQSTFVLIMSEQTLKHPSNFTKALCIGPRYSRNPFRSQSIDVFPMQDSFLTCGETIQQVYSNISPL